MPRPWACRVHGAAAPTHWTRNGRNPRARARRQVCSLCRPPKGPTCEGLDRCPRCDAADFVRITTAAGRRYRRCRPCTRLAERRWKVRMGLSPLPDGWPDPWVENAAALDRALGRSA